MGTIGKERITVEPGTAQLRVLDAAEQLYYANGVQAVGMDAVRTAAGVSLKRLYQLHPSKADLVEAVLRRRDTAWRGALADHVDSVTGSPEERLLAVYDWLREWFAEPGYRGCAFVNSFGELGATAPAVAEAARAHKAAFRQYLADLVAAADLPGQLADQLALLAEGAITTAAIAGSTEPAGQARAAARTLITAARATGPATAPVTTRATGPA
ncbi:TetR/AcrR family transcriptional regulator [Kitasatospora viridis]|uniref:TetR family transcriptional regulator n=1 Tax=Kitasatospora viridis TaxID=281105 RepID=A0A561SDL2_9ACTN|nr:TetR/AcrR family transcriptional regulator [Kitasatospora viridis]TWF72961.1 TetR family transcriptional regulator [Kitasatospora viridis]